jgi:hypothetical protein
MGIVMAAIDRSAYPRFASKMSTRELVQHFTPSGAELDWARSNVRGLRLQQAILINLKCFQHLHYFPADADFPTEVIAHLASVLGRQEDDKSLQELRAATRYRQHATVRQYLSISPFYGKKGRLVAVRAAHAAALIVQQRVDLVNAIIDELVRQRYELPAYSTLENIGNVVASSGESKLMSLVDSRLRHSTRVGAAQDLAELDIDLVAITQAGGWKSTRMPLQYAEKINAARSGMARAAEKMGRDSTNALDDAVRGTNSTNA